MADAGRTAHAPRVAASVRPAAAAVLFPLLAAGFLAVLWLLGGAPAHALDLSGATGGSSGGSLGAATGDGRDDGDRTSTDPGVAERGSGFGTGGSVEPGAEILGSEPAASEQYDFGVPGSDLTTEGTGQDGVTGAEGDGTVGDDDSDRDAPAQDAPRSAPSELSTPSQNALVSDGDHRNPDDADGPADHTTDQVTDGVTGEVTAPVAETLGSVHQRLDGPAHTSDRGGLSDSGLSDAGLPVAEVGEGARRVVEGLDHAAEHGSGTGLASAVTGQDLLAPDGLTDLPAGPATASSLDDGNGEPDGSDDRGHAAETRASQETGPDSTGFPTGSASAPGPVEASATAQGNGTAPDTEPRSGGDDHLSSHLASAPNTSAQTTGAAAPGVAGYLTSSPVAGPASTAVRAWSDAPHGVPSDPADDPTVSPD